MRLEIVHRTAYHYQAPVYLEPQVLRIKPREDATQRLLDYRLQITPVPASLSDNVDLGGNSEIVAWFANMTDSLLIEATSVVETLRANPFEFLWEGEASLPMRYPAGLQERLAPYLKPEQPAGVQELGRVLAESVGGQAPLMPQAIATVLYGSYRHEEREEGTPLPAEVTLERSAGACRDLTVLFMAVARSQGLASRFVSGYHYSDDDARDMHAWPEVYLPGGGWRGFDPTIGLAVADRHIALAAAPDYMGAAPLSGTYRGRSTARLETELSLRRLGPKPD